MFNSLSDKLDKVFRNLKGKGYLTEQNIKDSLREIRMALLEADVNFRIVKNFVAEVQTRALGTEVMKSLTPGQQMVKIVYEQLAALMDTEGFEFKVYNNRLTKVMMVGLQGSGKTTACAKLALLYRKNNIKPMMVACDVHRPAAIEQLKILGKQVDIPVVSVDGSKDVIKIADEALRQAQKDFTNLLIFDTAGRLHIDAEMMEEVSRLKDFVKPDYIFFVADAMTGQEAVNVAKEFHDKLAFDAVILTKMDSDARGGAALSIKAVTERPVAFIGTGEKTKDIEVFHAERMASRILGMGDVLTLIEKAEETLNLEEEEKLARKMLKNQFTLNDYLKQMQSIKKMGSLESIIRMIPGLGSRIPKDAVLDDDALKHVEAIIQSMTEEEREKPDIINGSRRLRIAKGCGRSVTEVNRLLRVFNDTLKMMKRFNNPKGRKELERMMGG